jgi:hypothetical protein
MLEARERCDLKPGCSVNFCGGSSLAINGGLFGRVSEQEDMPGIEHNQENRTAQQQVEVCKPRAGDSNRRDGENEVCERSKARVTIGNKRLEEAGHAVSQRSDMGGELRRKAGSDVQTQRQLALNRSP